MRSLLALVVIGLVGVLSLRWVHGFVFTSKFVAQVPIPGLMSALDVIPRTEIEKLK
jgi:hypothetical protein